MTFSMLFEGEGAHTGRSSERRVASTTDWVLGRVVREGGWARTTENLAEQVPPRRAGNKQRKTLETLGKACIDFLVIGLQSLNSCLSSAY